MEARKPSRTKDKWWSAADTCWLTLIGANLWKLSQVGLYGFLCLYAVVGGFFLADLIQRVRRLRHG